MTLHNWFSGLDARALQNGMQRFCDFFLAGAGGSGGGHFGSSPLMEQICDMSSFYCSGMIQTIILCVSGLCSLYGWYIIPREYSPVQTCFHRK